MKLVYQEEVIISLSQCSNVACCCKYPSPPAAQD